MDSDHAVGIRLRRAYTALQVCGVLAMLSGLVVVVAAVMVSSWPAGVAGALSPVGGLGMATFGGIGKRQSR